MIHDRVKKDTTPLNPITNAVSPPQSNTLIKSDVSSVRISVSASVPVSADLSSAASDPETVDP